MIMFCVSIDPEHTTFSSIYETIFVLICFHTKCHNPRSKELDAITVNCKLGWIQVHFATRVVITAAHNSYE